MRKLLLSGLILSGLLFSSCGESGPQEEPIVAPEGMHVLDLNRYGKPFIVFVPDTVKNKLEIVEQSYGALDIMCGNNFGISILGQKEDIELRKTEIKDDEINKFKSYIVEEPEAIFWESAIIDPEFHFLINFKVGESEYNVRDLVDPAAEKPLGKEAVQKMFDSAKSIKEFKKAAPEAA
ncbi:MAG: hypothetical protein AB7O73_13260 [Bacteroidia bacterium]